MPTPVIIGTHKNMVHIDPEARVLEVPSGYNLKITGFHNISEVDSYNEKEISKHYYAPGVILKVNVIDENKPYYLICEAYSLLK